MFLKECAPFRQPLEPCRGGCIWEYRSPSWAGVHGKECSRLPGLAAPRDLHPPHASMRAPAYMHVNIQ